MRKFLALALMALTLNSCSWLQEMGAKLDPFTQSLPDMVALARAGATPAVRAEVAYNGLPSCKKVVQPALCRDIAITRKLKSFRLTAYDALSTADQAAKIAVTADDRAKAMDLIGAANSAVDAFKLFANAFAPPAVSTTPAQ